jgi:hypothetical protein
MASPCTNCLPSCVFATRLAGRKTLMSQLANLICNSGAVVGFSASRSKAPLIVQLSRFDVHVRRNLYTRVDLTHDNVGDALSMRICGVDGHNELRRVMEGLRSGSQCRCALFPCHLSSSHTFQHPDSLSLCSALASLHCAMEILLNDMWGHLISAVTESRQSHNITHRDQHCRRELWETAI